MQWSLCAQNATRRIREVVWSAEFAPGLEVMGVVEMDKYQRCTLCSDTTQMLAGDGEDCVMMMASQIEDGRVVMEFRS